MALYHKREEESEKLGSDFQWKKKKLIGYRNLFANWLGEPQLLFKKNEKKIFD